MCVAIIKPRGAVLPPVSSMYDMFSRNPDGAGFAWSDGTGGVNWKKGYFNPTRWIEDAIRKCTIDRSALLHARIATRGSVCKGNTHPFPITRNQSMMTAERGTSERGVMVHNGMININVVMPDASDSMQFAHNMAATGAYKKIRKDKQLLNTIETHVSNGKIAILYPDGDYIAMGKWIFDKGSGCYFSNMLWRRTRRDFDLFDGKPDSELTYSLPF